MFLINGAAAQTLELYKGDTSNFGKLLQNTGGNTIFSNGAHQYQWPGVYFEARFNGVQVFFKIDDNYNRFRVLIDNQSIGLISKPAKATYMIAGLPSGAHTIRIEKLSESQGIVGSFYGFFAKGASPQLPPPQRKLKLEFIGDSYLVGYGNLSSSRACPGKLFENTDNTQSYGQIVARHFNADFQINAYSGIGMARNYNNNMGEKNFAYFYERPIFASEFRTSPNYFKPDIIYIALGTNDFSTPIKPNEKWQNIDELKQDYISKYLAFLGQIRGQNPNAKIIMAINIDANNNYRSAFEIVAREYSKADANFYPIFLPKLQNTGCDWHPNLNDHLSMAQIAISKIKDLKIR